jgi:hypothetical protein
MRPRLVISVMALTASALLGGCGRDADSGQVAGGHTTQVRGGATAAAMEEDLVSAVSAGSSAGSGAPVSLKFRMPQAPRVGQSQRIELVLVQQPGLDIDSMLVSLQAGDGLTLESDRSFEYQAPAAGATQRMAVTVRAGQAGLLSLGATVLVDTANSSVTRTFSIPLIVAP